MQDFKTLQVWIKAHALTLDVYRATVSFPPNERFELTSQIRRACSSIPANIAEGSGRKGNAEFAHFCHIAMGSASELEYHLLLARDLDYLPDADYQRLNDALLEVKRMLNAFIQRLVGNRQLDPTIR